MEKLNGRFILLKGKHFHRRERSDHGEVGIGRDRNKVALRKVDTQENIYLKYLKRRFVEKKPRQ